jgi:hypothetical protein
VSHNTTSSDAPAYEPPQVAVIGTVHELTQGCDKRFGGTDGFTFGNVPIFCRGS